MLDDNKETYALTLGELDEPYFRATVQQDPPDTNVKARLRSHRLIAQARKYLSGKLQDMTEGLDAKQLVTKLRGVERVVASRLKLVAVEVCSEEEALLIFETLNDRGLKLAVPDLVLNHLMRTANNDTERKRIRLHWNSVVENLGQQKVSTFIRHMWVSRYGDVKTQGLFREIRESLSARKVDSLEFADLCAKESKFYAGITNVDKEIIGQESTKHIDGLVNYLEADRALPLLLSGTVCLEPTEFAKLARAVIAIVVRHSLLADLNPVDLESKLYAAARALRTKHGQSGSSKASLKEAKEILRSIHPTREQIRTALPSVHLTKKQAQYVITALAECAQSKTKVVEFQTSSIEHVFPENAELGDWPNVEELEPYTSHIGNLTVLEPTYNRQAGRKSYQTKKTIYTQSEIVMSRDIATRYPSWDVQSIMHRAAGLMPLIDEVWPESI